MLKAAFASHRVPKLDCKFTMSDKYLLVIGSIAIAFLLFVSSGLVKEDSSDHQVPPFTNFLSVYR